MADMKRTFRINMWKILICAGLIGWFLLMYLDPTHLSPDSPLTGKWFVLGLIMIVFGFLASVFVWVAQIRSAKTIHCHGSDTWDPAEWHEIPAEVKDGKIVAPRLLIRGIGGFKAMGIYVGGRGAKGWDVVVDLPGIWYRIGPNLVLNTDTRETYVGEYEHQEIYNIIDKMNTYFLGIPGMMSIADDTPINVYAIPRDYPMIPDDVVEHFATLRQAEKYFSEKLADKESTILDLKMSLSNLRGANHGQTSWQQAMKPKGVENTGTEPPATTQ